MLQASIKKAKRNAELLWRAWVEELCVEGYDVNAELLISILLGPVDCSDKK